MGISWSIPKNRNHTHIVLRTAGLGITDVPTQGQYPLVMDNGPWKQMKYLLIVVFFNGYVKLPDGIYTIIGVHTATECYRNDRKVDTDRNIYHE